MNKSAPTRQAAPQSTNRSSSGSCAQQFTRNTWIHLQSNVGNQAMSRLLQAGMVQAKLRASQPGDADESEADRAAEKIVAATHAPVIQRKCACGGTCSKCSEEDEQRRVPRLQLSSRSSRIQRAAKDGAALPEASSREAEHRGPTPGLIVEDGARISSPGQMQKSAFFNLLEADICATADAELAAVGRSTKSCPYIEKWLAFYRGQSAAHIERALIRYAPEATEATTARDYIRDVRQRVRRAVSIWAKTGRITGVPPGVGLMPSGTGGEEKKQEGFGTGLLRAVSGVGRPQFKEKEGSTPPATDAESVRSQLGRGRALDSPVRSRMESAFGRDFSSVRIHDGGSAGNLSSQLNARAFTIGNDIAFGVGEYKPGTRVGDALIAHELAHVVQQGAGSQAHGPMLKGAGDDHALEKDADDSAVAATMFVWGRSNETLKTPGRTNLRSHLRLQRCGGESDKVVLKNLTAKQRQQFAKEFIDKNFPTKDRETARKILDDMLQSGELSFKDEETLKTEIFKRMETTKFMQESQALYGKAFEYPNHPKAKACLPNNKDGKKDNPRVNKAAESYWGPVQDPQGDYHWDLSNAGKQDAYKALTTLFTPQKSICDMTLIHCDYLASVVHLRAFAESIGIEEFNKRVKNGDIEMRLAWNGFQDLEDIGWFHSKKSISLREVRPANENDLVIGDHVIFWNHRAYDALNLKIGNAWRLENAILVYRSGKEDHFRGHGSGDKTNQTMRERLAIEYNKVVGKAIEIATRTHSKNAATASKAVTEMNDRFPNVQSEAGDWVVKAKGKTFKLVTITWKDADLTGLRSPDDPSKMNCVKRPSEAPGESC